MSDETTQQRRSRVPRWLMYAGIALINVLCLALFAAYFSGQKLDSISLLAVFGDTVGVVVGVLGIRFFVLSERLNWETARNLERTTATVDDLRNQMWGMIDRTSPQCSRENKQERTPKRFRLMTPVERRELPA